MLNGSTEQDQSERLLQGSVSQASDQGAETANHETVDGSRAHSQAERQVVASVFSAFCQGTFLLFLTC